MKIEAPAGKLADIVKRVLPAVTGRSSLPVLNHLLFTAADDGLNVSGTDLEISIALQSDEVAVSAPGAATVDARLVSSLLSKLPATDMVTLESTDKGGLLVKSSGRKYTLAGVPPEEFMKFPVMEEDSSCIEIAEGTLGRIFAEVLFAVADSKSGRTHLQSVYLCGDEGTLRAVATDTHSLAVSNTGIECGPIKAIIPDRFARIVASSLSGGDCPVRILVDRHSIFFALPGGLSIHVRLIEGTFPNYQRVIPTSFTSGMTFNRQEVLQAVARVMLVAVDWADRVAFSAGPDGLRLWAISNNGQECAEEVALLSFTGDPIETGINGKFLIECLSAYTCETVRVETSSALKPLLFSRPEEKTAQFSIVMPMAIPQ